MKGRVKTLAVCVALAGTTISSAASWAHGPASKFKLPPRNLILIIGDGMDSQQITIARNYLVGAAGELNLDQLPQRSSAQVLTYQEAPPHLVSYVADSANGGTSLATGAITSTGRIGTTVGTDEDVPNILELAKAAGYRIGVVTSASVTDATPAAFLAHVSSRGCEGPADMYPSNVPFPSPGCLADLKANGGKGSIAEQIAAGAADVVLGGGTTKFGQTVEEGGKTVLQLAQQRGFNHVGTAAALDAFTGGRLLGLFSASTLPVKLAGPAATRIAYDANNEPIFPAAITCTNNPAFNAVPSLAAMAQKAVEVLSARNPKGFVLMIESASIDKQAHSRNPCGHIGELEQLDEVVGLIRNYAGGHPGTLLLVTADHGQSPQLLPETTLFGALPGQPTPAPLGHVASVNTQEGAVMKISYATTSGGQEDHTGTEVPVFGYGGMPFALKSFVRQPELFFVMKRHLRLPADH